MSSSANDTTADQTSDVKFWEAVLAVCKLQARESTTADAMIAAVSRVRHADAAAAALAQHVASVATLANDVREGRERLRRVAAGGHAEKLVESLCSPASIDFSFSRADAKLPRDSRCALTGAPLSSAAHARRLRVASQQFLVTPTALEVCLHVLRFFHVMRRHIRHPGSTAEEARHEYAEARAIVLSVVFDSEV